MLSRTMGAVVLTATAGRTRRSDISKAAESLATVGAKVQGIVVSEPGGRPGRGRKRGMVIEPAAPESTIPTIPPCPAALLPARSIPARLFRSRRRSVRSVRAEEGLSAVRLAPGLPGTPRPLGDIDTATFDAVFRTNRPAPSRRSGAGAGDRNEARPGLTVPKRPL
jgi:hypothetical protein